MNATTSSPFRPPLPKTDSTSQPQLQEWTGLHGAARALAIASCARKHKAPVVVLCASSQQADELVQDLQLLADDADLPILTLPDWETLPYDLYSPDPRVIAQRLATLAALPRLKKGILVLPMMTALQRLPPTDYVHGRTLMLKPGDRLDPEQFRSHLPAAGYRAVETVANHGEFAIRGGVIDLFPAGTSMPFRIELFDDEVESLRTFDPDSQRTVDKVQEIKLLPAREYPFTEEAIGEFRRAFRARFDSDIRQCDLYQDLRQGYHPAGLEYYLPLFFDETAQLFDYVDSHSLWLQMPQVHAAGERFHQQVAARCEQRRHDMSRPVLEPTELYASVDDFEQGLSQQQRIHIRNEDIVAPENSERSIVFETEPAPALHLHAKAQEPAAALKEFLARASDKKQRTLIVADTPGRREVLLETLHDLSLRPKVLESWHSFRSSDEAFAIAVMPISSGFQLGLDGITVLTEAQLFANRQRTARQRAATPARDMDAIVRNLTELAEDAPVVHEDHGVGRYRGLSVIDVGGMVGEFLTLEYFGGDKLYVPVSDLQLISRYTGADPENAPWHRLGGDQWEKAKKKASKRIRDLAAELLHLYARREAAKGHAHALDRRQYVDFAATFPYEETIDQQNAIDAVLNDLQSKQPMDRVVCGDVGFGKTEVALRAAFVAAHNGKQVAVLSPTTLLAQQHYNLFKDRFADWPVRVELLSRVRSDGAAKVVLDDLAAGKVDIIVGTHRLLSKEIEFNDLGLVIVDEEQRFGVQQKEKLKRLRANVDLLTLTATPIPRTLNMAMSGIRDLSIIATPPARRSAIQTSICGWNPEQIREAVERELQRGGQVYFVHNEVRSMPRMERELKEILPGVDIVSAHGQMPARELETIMRDFYARRHQVLLSTTIIENGIDVPNANTILINRADRFGLAQLHQMRGRVGRSHHQAYAYLIVPDWRAITSDARKRLEAIASLQDLGVGFTLASHDLEIRGAGELLGAEQSGQIHEVGYTLYMEMLERAVESLRNGVAVDFDQPLDRGPEVELHIPALIPEDYLPDINTRLVLYQRIAAAKDADILRALQVEMIDRFGLLTPPIKNLFAVAQMKLQAKALGLARIELGEDGGFCDFKPEPNLDPGHIIQLIQKYPFDYRLQGERLKITCEIGDDEQRLTFARDLFKKLSGQPQEH